MKENKKRPAEEALERKNNFVGAENIQEQEQIKRMANDIANICPDLVENCCGQVNCITHLSLSLFKEGYRNKSDVVREIYERIRKTLASLEYKANTSRKTVRVEELIEQMDWVLHQVVPCAISEVLMNYDSDTEDSK